MPAHDDLGMRMKTFYEQIPKTKLMRRTPVIIRIDGKAFHTFTKGFNKPFDNVLIEAMQVTMRYLCENIQGCVLGYCQSDEISLLLIDYKKLNSAAWFDNEVQKICSISASMATLIFNKAFSQAVQRFNERYRDTDERISTETAALMDKYNKAVEKGAMFDARCFNIPKEEVTNYFFWRQQDATRNSIEMVGQAYFSHAELHNKSCNDIQDMLHEQIGVNWDQLPIFKKRGTCCRKQFLVLDPMSMPVEIFYGFIPQKFITPTDCHIESSWVIDVEIPIFKNEEREYIEELILAGES